VKLSPAEYWDRAALADVRGMSLSDLVREEMGLPPADDIHDSPLVEHVERHLRAVGK
jgi:hypothetical protein